MEGATEGSDLIVLVDRSGNLERRLKTALLADGYDVATVETAEECLHLIETARVSSVVSEYTLPTVDGVTLLRSVRISHPSLPFVLVPSDGSESIAGEAIAAGVSAYVPQTETTATVRARIRADLDEERSPPDDEHHHRYQRLVTMAPAPINIFDETGATIWGNDAVLELLGLEGRHELVGRPIFEFIHPDDRPVARRELEAVIEEKDSVGPTAMKLLRPDGQVRHIQVATAIGRYLGADIGQAIIVDVTEREELYRQLKVLSTWLRHNIRNEMNIIHGLAGEIRQDDTDRVAESATEIQAHVDHLVAQADRERAMVDLLVDPPSTVSIDIGALIEDLVRAKRSEYPRTEITVIGGGGGDVSATPQLRDAIEEILDNAIRHNDTQRPRVRVEFDRPEPTRLRIRIRDDGPGIPASERAFLRFEQAIDQLNHGSGLGLLFAHRVVTQSGGSLRFSETDPRGSTVTVTLPTATERGRELL